MSELNESVHVTIGDSTVVTVPLVDNLTASNAAPKASTVGAALEDKVDASDIMEYVEITVNGVASDNQGVIEITGADIPVNETSGAGTIKAAVAALEAKTAADIPYVVGTTIKAKVDALETAIDGVADNLYATDIPMSSTDSTTIAAKVTAIDGKAAADIPYGSTNVGAALTALESGQTGTVKVSAQTFTDGEKVQARTNIGALGSGDVADAVRTTAQSFGTDAQAQARANIGALGASDMTDVVRTSSQSFSNDAKTQARTNIGAIAASDLANALSGMIIMQVSDLFEDYALESGGYLDADYSCPAVTGYTPLGIVGYGVYGGSSTNALVYRLRYNPDNGNIRVGIRNTGSSAANLRLSVSVLYIKSASE